MSTIDVNKFINEFYDQLTKEYLIIVAMKIAPVEQWNNFMEYSVIGFSHFLYSEKLVSNDSLEKLYEKLCGMDVLNHFLSIIKKFDNNIDVEKVKQKQREQQEAEKKSGKINICNLCFTINDELDFDYRPYFVMLTNNGHSASLQETVLKENSPMVLYNYLTFKPAQSGDPLVTSTSLKNLYQKLGNNEKFRNMRSILKNYDTNLE